jgi:hypothetical protein
VGMVDELPYKPKKKTKKGRGFVGCFLNRWMGCTGMLLPSSNLIFLLLFLLKTFGDKREKGGVREDCKTGLKQDLTKKMISCPQNIFQTFANILV